MSIYTRDLARLGYGNVLFYIFTVFRFFFFFCFNIFYIVDAFFSWTLNFILLLTPLSPGTKIIYCSTIFRTSFSYYSIKYFNYFLVAIKTSPSLSCFRSAVLCFIVSQYLRETITGMCVGACVYVRACVRTCVRACACVCV